ncbi:bile acid:sodium symporter family protein [uncultured Croceitalea sp.]|uniref:bile acid:sodium symporter family protein n=1 Tax=uncultured Croceitalea sp. TaxID=1798908 RepID=UPI0033058C55
MDNISNAILALSLIIIMFGMGLSLSPKDFVQVFVRPKAILIGLICQLILLPIIGFSLINTFTLSPEIAIGVIIMAACPGGPTSNLITHLANGDTALSVSLTAISSLITLISIPFIINLGLQHVLGEGTVIQLDILATILQVFIIVILPVALGMFLKAKKPDFALKMEKPVKKASGIFFVLVLVAIIVKERALLFSYLQQAGLVSLALNILTMGVGYLLGYLFHLSLKQRISIAIEGGIQNGTLGISIATILLQNTAYAVTPAVYGIIMFITAGVFIYWSNRALSRQIKN